jgi:hypothetical protein
MARRLFTRQHPQQANQRQRGRRGERTFSTAYIRPINTPAARDISPVLIVNSRERGSGEPDEDQPADGT